MNPKFLAKLNKEVRAMIDEYVAFEVARILWERERAEDAAMLASIMRGKK